MSKRAAFAGEEVIRAIRRGVLSRLINVDHCGHMSPPAPPLSVSFSHFYRNSELVVRHSQNTLSVRLPFLFSCFFSSYLLA